jgi:hypothetical protein
MLSTLSTITFVIGCIIGGLSALGWTLRAPKLWLGLIGWLSGLVFGSMAAFSIGGAIGLAAGLVAGLSSAGYDTLWVFEPAFKAGNGGLLGGIAGGIAGLVLIARGENDEHHHTNADASDQPS